MDNTKWKLCIEVDGDSAKDLFAVGVNELKYFLEEKFNVAPQDIKSVQFHEVMTEDEIEEYIQGKRLRYFHRDNYSRKE